MHMSLDVYQAAERCRMIDRVTVKGSKVPVELYTFDIVNVPATLGCPCSNADHHPDPAFGSDAAIAALQNGLYNGFMQAFTDGVSKYLAGNWAAAKESLLAAKAAKPDDGPSETLLEFMGATNFVRPVDWSGFRELTEK